MPSSGTVNTLTEFSVMLEGFSRVFSLSPGLLPPPLCNVTSTSSSTSSPIPIPIDVTRAHVPAVKACALRWPFSKRSLLLAPREVFLTRDGPLESLILSFTSSPEDQEGLEFSHV